MREEARDLCKDMTKFLSLINEGRSKGFMAKHDKAFISNQCGKKQETYAKS